MDESAGANGKAKKPRKRPVFISDAEWQRIRIHYESDPQITHGALATIYNVSVHTIERRAMLQKWKKQDRALVVTADRIQEQTQAAILQASQGVIEKAARSFVDKLEPLIAREKTRYTRAMIKRQRVHHARLDQLAESNKLKTARDEAMFAKALVTHDDIMRRTLGMDDGKPVAGSLNLSILTGQAAVQVVSGKPS